MRAYIFVVEGENGGRWLEGRVLVGGEGGEVQRSSMRPLVAAAGEEEEGGG